jgi:AcrR family transcriptional regulator
MATSEEDSVAEASGAGKTARRRGRPRLDDEMVPRILDAAERLFASRPRLNVSVRDIAAEAGLPHSAIYRYFDNKDDVLRQVMARGRLKQLARDARSRDAGDTFAGAVDWLMRENRAYALVIAHAALEGETPSSLGLDPEDATARQAVRLLEEGAYPFALRTDHDRRLVAAAVMALSLGWAVAEEWIVEATGLDDRDRAEVREELGAVMSSIMALAQGDR